jgi:hypothetical protein
MLAFHGRDQAGQEATGRPVAAALKRMLLRVDLAAAVGPERPALRVMRAALPNAGLTNAISCLFGWDACLTAEAAGPTGGAALGDLLSLIDRHPQLVIIAGQTAWQARGSQRERRLIELDFPAPDFAHRQALWTYFIGQCGVAAPDAPQFGRPTPRAPRPGRSPPALAHAGDTCTALARGASAGVAAGLTDHRRSVHELLAFYVPPPRWRPPRRRGRRSKATHALVARWRALPRFDGELRAIHGCS